MYLRKARVLAAHAHTCMHSGGGHCGGGGIIRICALSLSAWILNLFLYSEVSHHGGLEAGDPGL